MQNTFVWMELYLYNMEKQMLWQLRVDVVAMGESDTTAAINVNRSRKQPRAWDVWCSVLETIIQNNLSHLLSNLDMFLISINSVFRWDNSVSLIFMSNNNSKDGFSALLDKLKLALANPTISNEVSSFLYSSLSKKFVYFIFHPLSTKKVSNIKYE